MKRYTGNFTVIPNSLLLDSQLTVNERMLLCVLLKYCGQKETCWPSQETLGKNLGYSSRTIRDIAKSLIRQGLIKVKRTGFGRSNTYTMAGKYEIDRTTPSPKIRNSFPFQSGSQLPTINTYEEGKEKNEIDKGMELLRAKANLIRGLSLPPNSVKTTIP